MRIIIVGAGSIGRYLAELLIDEGNQVVVIDKDEALCKDLASEIDALVIHGDITRLETFTDAEIGKADVVIAVTPKDEVNLLASLFAKEQGVPREVARVSDPNLIEVFERLGIEKAICPEVEAAHVIRNLITGRFGIVELISTSSGDLKLLDITVGEGSDAAGKRLIDLQLPKACSVLAVYSGTESVIPRVDTVLNSGDRVVLITRADGAEEIEKLLAG
ncbi:MAG: potassium channel family protein [Candidatus Bathyarchaeia archaeon]